MPAIDYPEELRKSHWDKKKALAGADEVADLLKALEKKHQAVDWARMAPGWAKGLSGEAALRSAYQALDKDYRVKVMPLRLEAGALATAAAKAAKAKDAAKPLKDAAAQIDKAAQGYASALQEGLQALEVELSQALEAAASSGDGEEEGESSSQLADPKRLLKQLQLCKADPARRLNFAMLDDGKQDPVLVVHVRQGGRAMMSRLIKDIGVGSGAFGQLSVADTKLLLIVEKKVAGLAKRIRISVRACGFKLGKVVLADPSGAVLDEDEASEDGATIPQAPPPATGAAAGDESREVPEAPQAAPGGADAGSAFNARLAALLPTIQKAIAEQRREGQAARVKASEAAVFARRKDFDSALRLLDEIAAALSVEGAGPARPGKESLLAGWNAVRADVLTRLRGIAKEIAAARHAQSTQAVIEINAVIKNITAEPDSPQKIAELRRYLEQDDVVQDVSELASDVRTPLLKALARLEA